MSCVDPSVIPTIEPETLVNMTTWRWTKTISNISPDDYELKYFLTQQVGDNQHKIELIATNDSGKFLIDYASDAPETQLTADQIDQYTWQSQLTSLTDPNEIIAYQKGTFNIVQRGDLVTDPRTHNEIMRDAILEYIQDPENAPYAVKRKQINDRSLEKYTMTELNDWLTYYENLIAEEQANDRACSGEVQRLQRINTVYLGIDRPR